MPEQWCPFAIRLDGPREKYGYPGGIQGVPSDFLMTAPKRGEVKHDSTGPLAPTLSVLMNHPVNSWHFTIGEDVLYQHYPVDYNCWHGNDTDPDDDVRANVDLVGIEHTRPSSALATPLNPWQLKTTIQITRWLMKTRGFLTATRFSQFFDHKAWLLCEHNDVGNTPTACPSGRIPWDLILRGANMPDVKQGLVKEPDGFLYLYNDGTPIRRYGASNGDPTARGREAYNVGGTWWWVRHFDNDGNFNVVAQLSQEEGD